MDDGYSFTRYKYSPPSAPTTTPPPATASDLRACHIGIVAAPASTQEAIDIVDKLADHKIRILFCEAFYGGETYFPSTALPPLKSDHAGVLRAAIDEGHKRGVAVYAVAHLLHWRNGAERVGDRDVKSIATEDVLSTGQTVSEAIAVKAPPASDNTFPTLDDIVNGAWVTPSDQRVSTIVTKLSAEIANVAGLAGLVFTDVAPPGYDDLNDSGVDLGYTPDMRLAYLRKSEQDPIDVTTGFPDARLGSSTSLGKHVPLYVDSYETSESSSEGGDDWNSFRKGISDFLMDNVFTAARSAAPALPIYRSQYVVGFVPVSINSDGHAAWNTKFPPTIPVWPFRELELGGLPIAEAIASKDKKWNGLIYGGAQLTPGSMLLFDFDTPAASTDTLAGISELADALAAKTPGP